jgi:hypothetical protein
MTVLNDAQDAFDHIWDVLADHRETALLEGDDHYDSQWETICEAMETLRVELGLPSPIERDHGTP